MLSAQDAAYPHTRPRIELPQPGSHLCSTVILRFSGVREATQRFLGLQRVVSINGHVVTMPDADKEHLDESRLSLPHGQYTASLELVNRTTHNRHFMVYQHLVAFSTSGAADCLTADQQQGKGQHPSGAAAGDHSADRGKTRRDAREQHMWRGTLRLLESLSAFPPASSSWKPRAGAKIATTNTEQQGNAGGASRWNCRPYSGFCWKDYHVQSRAGAVRAGELGR